MPAKTVDSQPGLALKAFRNGNVKSYVLYDALSFQKMFQKKGGNNSAGDWYDTLETSFFDNMLGYIEVDKPETNSWNAKEVKYSAAESGYGPLMYDIAMADNGGLIPDRNSVSDEAEHVWVKYMHRSDIMAQPLDDVDEPKTQSTEDDSELHMPMKSRQPKDRKLSKNEPIDHAYFLTHGGPNTQQLIKNNEQTFKFIADNFNLSQGGITDMIKNLTRRFFNQKSDDAPRDSGEGPG